MRSMRNARDSELRERGRARRALGAVRSHVQPGSFPVLLAAAVLLYVVNGLAADTPGGATLERVARISVACAGLYVLSANRATLLLGILVVALAYSVEARLWTVDPRLNRVLDDS